MKIIEANAGALTNFEVLDFLKSRGASKDTTRVIAPVAPSEYKVYDWLAESPACNQTREKINEFLEKSKIYNLAKAEVLNIINISPSSAVEIDPIIEQSEDRFGGEQLEELVNMVVEVFPPPPTEQEEGIDEDKEEIAEEKQIDDDGKIEASDEDEEENAYEGETGENKENADGEPIDEDDRETADAEPTNGDTTDGEQMEAS